MPGRVYFIGAGPGDPELLTIKARKIIETADVIVFADSLINPQICEWAKKGAQIHKSASLTLEETHHILSQAVKEGKIAARLQSGDPGIFGAIAEQMALLEAEGIDYTVIPGVSSLFAAAAALKNELTVPELSQTVIITRQEGKTPVPPTERLRGLASHQATLAVFLSISMIEQVESELLAGGYPADTPVAVVYRASWPEQKIIRTTLKDMAAKVKSSGITRQALILVGQFLDAKNKGVKSKLYDRNFQHGYREI